VPRPSRSLPPALLLAVAFLAAGCGDAASNDEPSSRPDSAAPEPPFPPRAAEPPATRAGRAERPAGTVVRIGGRPEGIAIDPQSGLLGVSTGGPSHSFALLDPATLAVRRTVALPSGARHVQAADGRFLIALEEADRLAVIEAASGSVRLIRAGDQPHDAAAVGADIVVGDEFGGTATIVRGSRVRATVPVDVQPGGVAAISEHVAAIVSVRAYTVALLDLRTLQLGPSQNAGVGPSHVVAAPDGRLFIADTRGGAILEYATRPRLKALGRVSGQGSPYGLAFDGRRARLWVTDVRGGRLLQFDVTTPGRPRMVRSYPTVAQPNSVAVAPATGAVVVAGQRGGLLQRIAP
jgi:DNA-binding beta-propeller fold protein YncE